MVSRVSQVVILLVRIKKNESNEMNNNIQLSLSLFLVSFAGLGFLAFYLAGKMKMFDERGVSNYMLFMMISKSRPILLIT